MLRPVDSTDKGMGLELTEFHDRGILEALGAPHRQCLDETTCTEVWTASGGHSEAVENRVGRSKRTILLLSDVLLSVSPGTQQPVAHDMPSAQFLAGTLAPSLSSPLRVTSMRPADLLRHLSGELVRSSGERLTRREETWLQAWAETNCEHMLRVSAGGKSWCLSFPDADAQRLWGDVLGAWGRQLCHLPDAPERNQAQTVREGWVMIRGKLATEWETKFCEVVDSAMRLYNTPAKVASPILTLGLAGVSVSERGADFSLDIYAQEEGSTNEYLRGKQLFVSVADREEWIEALAAAGAHRRHAKPQ